MHWRAGLESFTAWIRIGELTAGLKHPFNCFRYSRCLFESRVASGQGASRWRESPQGNSLPLIGGPDASKHLDLYSVCEVLYKKG